MSLKTIPRLIAALTVILVLTSCRTGGPKEAPTPATGSPLPTSRDGDTQPSLESVGRLAYIGTDGNVYVTTADQQSTVAITNDATAPPEGDGLSYHRVSWSPDGWLAFAAVVRSLTETRSVLYVTESPDRPAQIVGASDEHFVIYIHWSPVPCPDEPGCRRLAYLIQEGPDIGLREVRMTADEAENRLLGVGRPFYFSWSPNGRQMLWHTGGAHREDTEARLALYDLEQDQFQILPQRPGAFRAPAWSPQSADWLGVSSENGTGHLQNIGPREIPKTIATSKGAFAFAWSPDGDQIAYAVGSTGVALSYGPIQVFDLNTGKSSQVTDDGFRILGFFWAPDGRRIGYLTRLDLPNEVWMQWRTYDLTKDLDRGFVAFHPSPHMEYVISSFNQYGQSHRFWSPDGRYLVYADRDPGRADRVWLVDTWADRGADPIPIGGGTIGFWSWN